MRLLGSLQRISKLTRPPVQGTYPFDWVQSYARQMHLRQ